MEAALKRDPAIADAAVAVLADGAGGDELAAYVVWRPGAATGAAPVLAAAREILPDYMVPSTVTALPELPLTPNGKVDRRALPRPRRGGAAVALPAPPRTPVERAVAGIWQEVLGAGALAAGQNFFDAGGHSLLLVQVHRRLQEAFGTSVTLVELFGHPTIRGMAEVVAGGAGAASLDRRRERAQARRRRLASALEGGEGGG